MKCIVCGLVELTRYQTKYCSNRCQRKAWKKANRETYLEGKRRYRQEHKASVAQYHKAYKQIHKHVKQKLATQLKAEFNCLRCDTEIQLEVHHIKSQRFGGGVNDRNNLIVLCKPCHALWHKFFNKDYWFDGAEPMRAAPEPLRIPTAAAIAKDMLLLQ